MLKNTKVKFDQFIHIQIESKFFLLHESIKKTFNYDLGPLKHASKLRKCVRKYAKIAQEKV